MDKIRVINVFVDAPRSPNAPTSKPLPFGGGVKAMEMLASDLDKDLFSSSIAYVTDFGIEGGTRGRLGAEWDVVPRNEGAFIGFLRGHKPDIVHIYRPGGEEPFAIEAAKKAGVGAIVETNIFGNLDTSESGKALGQSFQISKMCAHRYAKWAGLSAEEFFEKGKVVYCPMDVENFEPIPRAEILKFRRGFGIPDDSPAIGRISRKDKFKWGDMGINALKRLVREFPGIRYLSNGTPDEVRKALESDPISKNIVFLDELKREQVPLFYQSLDVFAYDSMIGESFGYVIAEAMASRLPVVTNCTPLRDNAQVELVDHGVTGLVANTPLNFARAVSTLLKDKALARRMGSAGHDKVKKEFDRKRSVLTLEKAYVETLMKKEGRLDRSVADKYGRVRYFPSKKDIVDFDSEYARRLRSAVGGLDPLTRAEMFIYENFGSILIHKAAGKLVRTLKLRRILEMAE